MTLILLQEVNVWVADRRITSPVPPVSQAPPEYLGLKGNQVELVDLDRWAFPGDRVNEVPSALKDPRDLQVSASRDRAGQTLGGP